MRPIYGSTAGLFQPKMDSFTWADECGQGSFTRASGQETAGLVAEFAPPADPAFRRM